jgi:hypothetical protein
VYGRDEKCTQNVAGKPEGKSLLERPEHRWEDMDLKEIVCEDVTGFIWLWMLYSSILL